MATRAQKHSTIRSFERTLRIESLLKAGIISSADQIPADAIPVHLEFAKRFRLSLRVHDRPPYFQSLDFVCADCQRTCVWTAEEQRFWFEVKGGSKYSTAKYCLACRKRRKGIKN